MVKTFRSFNGTVNFITVFSSLVRLLSPSNPVHGRISYVFHICFNFWKPTGYLMHQQFNIQQLYALPTL